MKNKSEQAINLVNLFIFLQNIDFIYVTGDIVDHSVWSTSITANSDVITKVMNELKEEFPDTPIYPILGNHEPSPLNV